MEIPDNWTHPCIREGRSLSDANHILKLVIGPSRPLGSLWVHYERFRVGREIRQGLPFNAIIDKEWEFSYSLILESLDLLV